MIEIGWKLTLLSCKAPTSNMVLRHGIGEHA